MKSRFGWKWPLGLVLSVLLFAGTYSPEAANTSPVETTVTTVNVEVGSQTAAQPADSEAEADVVDAPATPVPSEETLPPNLRLTAPALALIRLADSGVDEGVMLAFVTNSTSFFDLGADEIIYLNDLGIPGSVVTAMMRRDQQLKRGPTTAAAGVPAPADASTTAQFAPAQVGPPVYYPPTPPPPAPEEMAPQVEPPSDYTTEAYPPSPPPAEPADTILYDTLSPYGNWVDVAGYGRCWQPTVEVVNPTWQPYFDNGHWVYTDCGWYWLSNYSWGWAPFHYGRWFRHRHLGWCWTPDDVWGPSWVSWRYTVNYCGWAPLPPGAWFRLGLGLMFHGRPVGDTFAFGLGSGAYRFVDLGHLRDSHLREHALPAVQASDIFNRSVVASRIAGGNQPSRISNPGIAPERVEAASGTPVGRVAIRDVNARIARTDRAERLTGGGRTLAVFRPQLPPSRRAANPPQRPQTELRDRNKAVAASTAVTPPSSSPQPTVASALPARPARPTPPPANPLIVSGRTGAWGSQPIAPPDRNTPLPSRFERSAPPTTPVSSNPPKSSPPTRVPASPTRTTPSASPTVAGGPSLGSSSRVAAPPTRAERTQPAVRQEAPLSGRMAENRFSAPVVTPPPSPRPVAAPSYQPPTRPAPVEAPRYTPPPVVAPPPSHPAPAMPAPASPASPSHSSSDKIGR